MKQKHVVVVGGGLIGLCSAYALMRDGHRVTILERNHLGSGAATGNAGELTPQQVAPLASPNTAKDVFRGIFTNSSYLSISPLQLPKLISFGLGFLLASSRSRMERGTAALAQFSADVLPSLNRMEADGVDISGGSMGFLMTNSNQAELVAAHAVYAERARRGWGAAPGPVLGADALHELEPALKREVSGGLMLPGEFSLDPITFVQSLIDCLKAKGVEVVEGAAVQRVGKGASVVYRDTTGAEHTMQGDSVVLAAGAWTTPILRASAIRSAPVVSGKGYSFTVPVERMPHTVIHALDRHCVAIPMHGRLRIVGMMEFDGKPEQFNPKRIEVLIREASQVVGGADWENRSDEWVGARPMTADGMPLLGVVEDCPEIVVAAGHNMHGLSLGPVTGDVVANLVAGRETEVGGKKIDLRPFAVAR